jgi:hypothetical protein
MPLFGHPREKPSDRSSDEPVRVSTSTGRKLDESNAVPTNITHTQCAYFSAQARTRALGGGYWPRALRYFTTNLGSCTKYMYYEGPTSWLYPCSSTFLHDLEEASLAHPRRTIRPNAFRSPFRDPSVALRGPQHTNKGQDSYRPRPAREKRGGSQDL